MEEKIATEITQSLRIELTPEIEESLSKRYTADIRAYEAFMRGESLHHQRTTRAALEAIESYEQAISIDPEYARAYVGLSRTHRQLGWWQSSKEHYEEARKAAQKAVEIDDQLAEGHQQLGRMVAMFDRDWLRAEREFSKAEELNPNLGTPYEFHLWMGNLEDAIGAVEREMARMDMTTAASQGNRGWAFLFCREYERAIQHARKSLDLQPQWGTSYHLLGQIYDRMGRHDEAVGALSRFLSLSFDLSAEETADLQRAYEKEGIEVFWNQYLELLQPRWARNYDISVIYGMMGEKDLAFAELEKMCRLPLHHTFPPDPQVDPLRSDPRFQELLRKLNLPEEAIQRHLALPGS